MSRNDKTNLVVILDGKKLEQILKEEFDAQILDELGLCCEPSDAIIHHRYVIIAFDNKMSNKVCLKRHLAKVCCSYCAEFNVIRLPKITSCCSPCTQNQHTQQETQNRKEQDDNQQTTGNNANCQEEKVIKELAYYLSSVLSQELSSRKFIPKDIPDEPVYCWLKGFLMAFGYTLEPEEKC